ncbi:hypothetical protein ACFVAJ_18745 [Agromyces sp. NPDC057679]|uniref:hypothetical protein n=1 Tax=Agromyces sp. NPDC057679 TaxID=3346207 RepID=UPI00366D98FD
MTFTTDAAGNHHSTTTGQFQDKGQTPAEAGILTEQPDLLDRYQGLLDDAYDEFNDAEERAQSFQIARFRAAVRDAYPNVTSVQLDPHGAGMRVFRAFDADGERVSLGMGELDEFEPDLITGYDGARRRPELSETPTGRFLLDIPQHEPAHDDVLDLLEERVAVKRTAKAANLEHIMPGILENVGRRRGVNGLGDLTPEQITALFDEEILPAIERIADKLR